MMKKRLLGDNYRELVQLILDLFSETTQKVVGYYDIEGQSEWCGCEEVFTPLCKYLRRINPNNIWEFCEEDHARRTCEEYFQMNDYTNGDICHLGLWNLSRPIYVNNKFYGTLITGQKILSSKEKNLESINKFNSRLGYLYKKGIVNNKEKKTLIDLFKKTEKIDSFDIKLLERLINTEKKIVQLIDRMEVQLQDRITKFDLIRHELHQPNYFAKGLLLESIIECKKILKETTGSESLSSKVKTVLNNIDDCSQELKLFSNIIENISGSFSDNELSMNIKRFDISSTIEKAISMHRSSAYEKNISIKSIDYINNPHLEIECDQSLMLRAFINIYQNAVKYSYTGIDKNEKTLNKRYVTTEIEEINNKLRISISNYGTGILKSELESGILWKDGERGILSSDRKRIGSGLGLPQIKKIIEAHGGCVDIDSKPLSSNRIDGPYLTFTEVLLNYYVNNS